MNYALIFAGGVGSRMTNSAIPKQFLKLYGKEIIIYTLEKFENCSDIDGIVVVCIESWIEQLKQLIKKYNIKKVINIVKGGVNGQLSIYNGLIALKEFTKDTDVVLIHDGVRPIISEDLILRNIQSVINHGSAITSVNAIETIVLSDENIISKTISRNNAKLAKAPQSFLFKDIWNAHNKALDDNLINFIDSASLMLFYNKELHLVDGNYDNIKITTPTDFYLFKALYEAENNAMVFA